MMSPRIIFEVILIAFLIYFAVMLMKNDFAQGKSETFNKNSLILAAP
ncbi:hypothetical protein RCH33_1303 [Flavobacterium daejeonense]|nr:hypothetical protein RCH33_1303 [Flavobacterium daejeonense]